MVTDNASAITSWYRAVQFRDPPVSDLTNYLVALQFGVMTQAQVKAAIEADPFTINIVAPIIREYQAAFGRVPDQAGLEFWVNAATTNPDVLATLSTTFAGSLEFMTAVGTTSASQLANYADVFGMYLHVLNRVPDDAGLTFWKSSGLTVAQLLNTFAQSPEFVNASAASIQNFLDQGLAGTPVSLVSSRSTRCCFIRESPLFR